MITHSTFLCWGIITRNKFILNKLGSAKSIITRTEFPYRNVLILLALLLLSGCGAGGYSEDATDNAINAVNVSNKNQYRALSENKNREPVSFQVSENVAYMNGIMDSTIPHLVKNLIGNYPQVDTIVMGKVLGTIDFSATLEAGHIVRNACLTTVVPSHGKVTSGGVHFFLGGCKRIVESGGKLGIHTWKYAKYDTEGNITGGKTAADFPVTSDEHHIYLDYHMEMGIPEEFYWFVVNTPFDNMHFLSQNEMRLYEISTVKAQLWGSKYRLVLDRSQPFKFGTAKFYVHGGVAIMHGSISDRTPIDFVNMLAEHPEVHTLEFGVVTGTLMPNSLSSINFGYVIRNACIKTKVGSYSYVLAEAVHAFISGCEIELGEGAKLGLASWIHGDLEDSLIDSMHSEYIDYYNDLDIPNSFYHYQLDMSVLQPKFVDINDLMNLGVL